MSRALEIYRKSIQELSLRNLGISNRAAAINSGQVRLRGSEALILSLPPYLGEEIGEIGQLQNPTTGNPYFMVDVSEVDGTDEVA